MEKLVRSIVIAVVGVWSISTAAAEAPTGSDPLPQCHRVNSDVGLLVRASASSNARKVGSLEKGDKVQLDGEELPETGAVYPMMKKTNDGAYWVKIKSPTAGYVLYTSEDDTEYRYIVPCKR